MSMYSQTSCHSVKISALNNFEISLAKIVCASGISTTLTNWDIQCSFGAKSTYLSFRASPLDECFYSLGWMNEKGTLVSDNSIPVAGETIVTTVSSTICPSQTHF